MKYLRIILLSSIFVLFILIAAHHFSHEDGILDDNNDLKERRLHTKSSSRTPVIQNYHVFDRNDDEQIGEDQVEDYLYDLAGTDPARGMQMLLKLTDKSSPEERLRLYGFFAAGLAAIDPNNALVWANGIEDKRISSHCIMVAFSVWTQRPNVDNYDILNSLKNYQNSPWAGGLLNNLVYHASSTDEYRILNWITENLSGQENIYYQSLESVMRSIGKHDSQRLFQIANEYELRGGAEESLGRVIFGIGSEQLSSALKVLQEWPGSSEAKTSISRRLLQSFIERDPESVMSYLENDFPTQKNEILSNNLTGWIQRDSSHFLDWLDRQDNDFKNHMFSNESALSTLGLTMPLKSIEIVQQTVNDENDRNRIFRPIVSAWGRNNPIEALQWLENQPVSVQRNLIDDFITGATGSASSSINQIIESSSIDRNLKIHILNNLR